MIRQIDGIGNDGRGGIATISGSFSEQTANQLATILGYGALPPVKRTIYPWDRFIRDA